jgi:hypothetical protein
VRDDLRDICRRFDTLHPGVGPRQDELRKFVGRWALRGVNAGATPDAPLDPVSGEEIYEWWDGGYFLVNRFNRPAASGPFNGMGWIGFDEVSGAYLSFSINNLGFLRIYAVHVSPGVIAFTGTRERGHVRLDSTQTELLIKWQRSVDGQRWDMLCDIRGERAG